MLRDNCQMNKKSLVKSLVVCRHQFGSDAFRSGKAKLAGNTCVYFQELQRSMGGKQPSK